MIEMWYSVHVTKTKLKQAYDHAFVIAYPDKADTVSQMDIEKAIVVDSWGGLSPRTLEAFLKSGNPYGHKLDILDIKISNRQESSGNPFHFSHAERMIQHIVEQHIMGISKDSSEVQQIFEQARAGRNIDRVYG